MTTPTWEGPVIEALTGCPLQPVDLGRLLANIDAQWQAGCRGLLVGHHNLNSLALLRRDADVHAFYAQVNLCYVDGVPVLWLMQFAGAPAANAVRFSLMDRLPDLLDWARARGKSVFYLGGAPETVARGREWLSEHYPDLRAGLCHGYFDDDAAVVEQINRLAPDLLLVGMGMPRQERWMLQHRERLDAGALLQAGGTLDYYAGTQRRPPAWMSRAGLGGVYRLAHSPRRLGRRYLVEPWRLVGPVLRLRRALRATL